MIQRALCAVALLSLSLTASAGTLAFSTYLGGTGQDLPFGVTADHHGNTIVVGATASTSFLGLTVKGTVDGFLVKLDPNGAIVFRMLLGGAAGDVATAAAVDADDNIYVTGYTQSADFPLKNAFQKLPAANNDAFLMKLTAGGDLVYSTFLGASGSDEGLGVAVDGNGRACVVLLTSSPDLPLVNAAHTSSGTPTTTYVATFTADGSALRYSTYLGGSGQDVPYGVRMDSAGNAYVGGIATSVNFPTTAGAYQTQLHGPFDGYLTKLDPNGAVVFSTFFGGAANDGISGLDVRDGGVYVTGVTQSTDFPTRTPLLATSPGPSSFFAAKFTTAGELVYSTYLGDGLSAAAGPSSVTVNSHGEAFVVFTQTTNLLPSKNGIQTSLHGPGDLYLLQLDSTGSTLQFATYFGGAGVETPSALTVDDGDRLLFTGSTNSTDLPLAHAAQSQFAGDSDGFVAAIQFNPPKRRAVQH